jgi:hypothetical protein
LPAINKSIGDNMGYNAKDAALMRAYQRQFPGADLNSLAALAGIPAADVPNYTINTVATPSKNAAFGAVSSKAATETQVKTATPRTGVNPITGRPYDSTPTPVVETTAARTPNIDPFTGRTAVPRSTPVVESNNTPSNIDPFTGRTAVPRPVPRPETTNTTPNINPITGREFVPTPTPRPPQVQDTGVAQATVPVGSRGSGEFLDTRGRAPTPQPDPSPPPPPPPRPVPEDPEVDFTEAYGDSYTEVTPIPPSTRRPGVEQAQPFQPPQRAPQTFEEANEDIEDAYSEDFRTPDDIARANRASVATPTPRPDITAPEPPPARPAQEISQVDDFGGTGITEVDDFGGPSRNVTPVDDFAEYQAPAQVDDFGAPSRNVTPVDDFAEYQAPAQVDDFAEINTPAQVDDFSAYSNNDFGTEDPGLDAFGPGPAPAQVDDFAEYQSPAQVDDFAEFRAPAQVDDFEDYSDNDFGAQVDDFGDQPRNAPFVDDFGEYGTRINDETQFDDFGDPIVPSQAQFGVDSFDEYGTRINDETQFDAFGDPIPPRVDNDGESLVGDDDTFLNDPDANAGIDGVEQAAISNAQTQAINAQAMKVKAQNQQTINEMREASGVKNADGDWRVKLRLAPQADYLYKAQDPGILAPLAVTDGIIFPYTPTIDVQYRAEYNNYQPTHSNYMHYFYKGSSVQTVQLQAEFTAQDTKEAEYLLACMHFLKSASKMFYGQDAQRGSPPPLLYLSGLGEYQFNEQPCVVSEFNLNLPSDVNYIRARSRHINRDDRLQFEKPLATATTNGNFSALNRLKTAATNALNGSPQPLQVGAKPFTPSPGKLGSKGATYVPTKMSMTINLLPIASRQQVSQQFSLKEYANGNLIKKGMW